MGDETNDFRATKQAPGERPHAVPRQPEVPQQRETPQRHTVPRQPAHDVFVSYSSNDKPVADAIVSRLEQAGIRCWVAPRDVLPGMLWGQAIVDAIATSRLMVVVLSTRSNDSQQVIREVERAIANNVVVVPFRIESMEPTGALAYYLASEHWLDAMTPPLESHIAQLVRVAQTLLEIESEAPRAQQSAAPPAPLPAAPPPPPGTPPVWRRWLVPTAVAAIGLAILGILAALFLLVPGEDASNIVEVPETIVEAPETVERTELAAGDCLQTPDLYAADPKAFWDEVWPESWPSSLGVVSCMTPHAAEVYFVGDAWEQDVTYPGWETIENQADARCIREFESYVGMSWVESQYWYGTCWYPSRGAWQQGDRQLGCVAYDVDDDLAEGSIKDSLK
jgi:hypothetical protein